MTAAEGLLLFDTNVLIHLIRDDALARAISARFELQARPERPLISVITVGESLAFAKKLAWGHKKVDKLNSLLRELVIVDVNSKPVLSRYADIDSHLSRAGRPIGQNDMWIGATASAVGAHLLTTDKDFDALDPDFVSRTWIDPAGGEQ